MRKSRDAYRDAIDKVRSEHRDSFTPTKTTMTCPKCGTVQQVPDVQGMRNCVKCGFEFRPVNPRYG